VKRRAFLALIAGAAVARPISGHAQPADRVRRVGVLLPFAEDDLESARSFAAFAARLGELGWTEGRNLRLDLRRVVADDERMLAGQAAELAASAPDAILAVANPSLVALQRQTRTIPVVFVLVSDPVGSGFVASLARPGGNATGFANFDPSIAGKWLEVLKQISPGTTRVTGLYAVPQPGAHAAFLKAAQAAGPSFGVIVGSLGVRDSDEIERTIPTIDGGLIVLPHPLARRNRRVIAELAARHRLPAIYPFRFFAESGGLISYGLDQDAQFRRAASYVDRILRGAVPGELPVEQPTKFELVVNLKAAHALGLTIPQSIMVRADEVIE
jgi:putative ABC transport system substrate-binding protein